MKLLRRQFLHLAAGAAALPAVPRFAWAQAYPTRPVRIVARGLLIGQSSVASFAAGAGLDVPSQIAIAWRQSGSLVE